MHAREDYEAKLSRGSAPAAPDLPEEYPVREYVGAMATELAQMARFNGDEPLARLLDAAAALSQQPSMPLFPDEPAPGDRPS
ncbi:MAG: hypothetical protein EON87_10185 [Brevundimonas sp.]|nr:MAG: hypothetical protein EON87_10185 [Brevundimonas sp.]